MPITTNLMQARDYHHGLGGYLLDLGADTATLLKQGADGSLNGKIYAPDDKRCIIRNVYIVTNQPENYGRTDEEIAALDESNNFDETYKQPAHW